MKMRRAVKTRTFGRATSQSIRRCGLSGDNKHSHKLPYENEPERVFLLATVQHIGNFIPRRRPTNAGSDHCDLRPVKYSRSFYRDFWTSALKRLPLLENYHRGHPAPGYG